MADRDVIRFSSTPSDSSGSSADRGGLLHSPVSGFTLAWVAVVPGPDPVDSWSSMAAAIPCAPSVTGRTSDVASKSNCSALVGLASSESSLKVRPDCQIISMFAWTQMSSIKGWIKRPHVNTSSGRFWSHSAHSERNRFTALEGWFILIFILNHDHVRTFSDGDFLLGLLALSCFTAGVLCISEHVAW